MRGGWHFLWGAFLLGGCAASPAPRAGTARAELRPSPPEVAQPDRERPTEQFDVRRYVDQELGFEIERPDGDEWTFAAGHEAPEGILIPVIVLHAETGAQVVVQVAPEVAPPMAFAERLAVGLRTKPGFTTTVPEPNGSGSTFRFTMGDAILGTVGISSSGGRLYVLLGTWPTDAPDSVARDVFAIVASLKTVVLHEAALPAFD